MTKDELEHLCGAALVAVADTLREEGHLTTGAIVVLVNEDGISVHSNIDPQGTTNIMRAIAEQIDGSATLVTRGSA